MFWTMRTLDRLHVEVQNTWTRTPRNRPCISIVPLFVPLAMMPLCSPSFSRTVAYLEFAKGHDWRLQKPVALYSFLQKFCVAVLSKQAQLGQNFGYIFSYLTLYEQNCWFITDQITSSLCILDFQKSRKRYMLEQMLKGRQ